MSGQMLPGQMSLWQLFTVKEESVKLLLKVGQNLMSNTCYDADIEFVVVVVGGQGLL